MRPGLARAAFGRRARPRVFGFGRSKSSLPSTDFDAIRSQLSVVHDHLEAKASSNAEQPLRHANGTSVEAGPSGDQSITKGHHGTPQADRSALNGHEAQPANGLQLREGWEPKEAGQDQASWHPFATNGWHPHENGWHPHENSWASAATYVGEDVHGNPVELMYPHLADANQLDSDTWDRILGRAAHDESSGEGSGRKFETWKEALQEMTLDHLKNPRERLQCAAAPRSRAHAPSLDVHHLSQAAGTACAPLG